MMRLAFASRFLQRLGAACLLLAVGVLGSTAAHAAKRQPHPAAAPAAPVLRDGQAEARLIEIYRLIGAARTRDALRLAEGLVRDHPGFQLAQLVYGDLLAAQTRPLRTAGDVPVTVARAAAALLKDLRDEAALRL